MKKQIITMLVVFGAIFALCACIRQADLVSVEGSKGTGENSPKVDDHNQDGTQGGMADIDETVDYTIIGKGKEQLEVDEESATDNIAQSSNLTDSEEVVDANAELIKNITDTDYGPCRRTARTLASLGIGKLVSAESIGAGNSIKVTAEDGKSFILQIDSSNLLQVVRSDTINGEVVYAVTM